MRIIAGSLKGRKFCPIKGAFIRPTADRVREAVFSIIHTSLENAVVADIFAGTGAMGIEALSRGAASAVFVDKSQAAISLIRTNFEDFNLTSKAKAICWDMVKNSDCLAMSGKNFDLVFVDPPYNMPDYEKIFVNLAKAKVLKPGAKVVLEHDAKREVLPQYGDFTRTDQRKYGKTVVSFFVFML